MPNPSNSEAMSKFLNENGFASSQLSSASFYDWKAYQSPFGKGTISLGIDGDSVTSSAALSPKSLFINDQEILGAEIGDTFTDANYRRQGLFSKRVRECISYANENGLSLIYGTPNSQSLPGYENKLGFPQCTKATIADLFIETDKYLVRKKFHRKVAFKPLSDIASLIYWKQIKKKQKKLETISTSLSWDEIKYFPDGIDGRWSSNREDYAFFLNRNTEYLNWRFSSNPNHYRIFIGRENGIIRCYFACTLKKTQEQTIGFLCDYVCWDDDQRHFLELFKFAANQFKATGANSIELYCSQLSPYYDTLISLGFRNIDSVVVIAYSGMPKGKELLESDGKWHFTMADADGV